ncbi:MAG: 3-phosphoserine/phosphohydroxythreonine transaminase [Rikenellaceae bacterium]
MKKHNFNAGPSVLPQEVLENAAKAVIDLNGSGLSLLSISHRTKDFEDVLAEAKANLKELLNIPDNYKIIFMGGGASTQFFNIPANFMKTKAGYINTGVWAKKALKEAKLYGEAIELATSADKNFNYIPKGVEIPADLDYLHITSNNTIYGTAIHEDMTSPVPVFADMSSDILSREIDVTKYAMIYGGAQKNMGPAGVAFVIVRDDMLENIVRELPSMTNLKIQADNDSMYNTPPVFPIFVINEVLKWVKAKGGVSAMAKANKEKAEMLYGEIERNSMFVGTAEKEDRSLMNICFVMSEGNEELAGEFLEFAKSKGMVGVKGHRLVGGFRASCYNALPKESVEALVACMQEFEQKHK